MVCQRMLFVNSNQCLLEQTELVFWQLRAEYEASDGFNALAAELTYTDLVLSPEDGGLTADDFVMLNADLTPAQLLGFFAVMQALLEPLTVEQKKIIYG